MNSLPPVDAHQLADRLASLLGEERSVLLEFLRHLARFDADALYAGFGYRSLFVYCTDRLRLSKSATFRRITTARLMRRFPIIGDFLADGRLCLTRVCMLKDVLTPENHVDLLQRASSGSEEAVEVLVATLRPKAAFADSVRKVPVRREAIGHTMPSTSVGSGAEPGAADAQRTGMRTEVGSAAEPKRAEAQVGSGAELLLLGAGGSEAEPDGATAAVAEVGSGAEPIAPSVPARPHRSRMEVEPLDATMYAVRMCVDRAFLDELEAVKAALSHKFPNGNFEDVLRECFRITLETCERRRRGSERRTASTAATQPVESPSRSDSSVEEQVSAAAEPSSASRYIPVEVRRKVWDRDCGRCAFVSADGRRCGSTWQVDFHHCDPFATGGPPTVENLSLRCRVHNLYEAQLAFGAGFMRSRIFEARKRRGSSVPPRNQRARTSETVDVTAARTAPPPLGDGTAARDL